MFADGRPAHEINGVGLLLVRMLTRAMDPDGAATDDDAAVARVIGDVWLAALMAWVTGRSSAEDTSAHMERAVRLILR